MTLKIIHQVILFTLYIACSSLSEPENKDTLIFVNHLIRHGPRSPVFNPDKPVDYDPNRGHLLASGLTQPYFLGKIIRKEYIEDKKFISPEYNNQEFLARSTDKDRSYETSNAYLMGLYPSGTGPKL